MKKSLLFYFTVAIFCLLISIPILLPYFNNGYFPTHDGEWAVVRLADMFREVRDLQIPPRYSGNLNFNYGYPLFNFAYPFPYYVGLIFYFLGFGFVGSIKLIFALSIPASAFFMFLASRNIWKNNWSALVSSILYLYFPYKFVDLFVRGSIGESIAFVIFPIILFCLSKISDNPKNNNFILVGGVAYACLVLAHNIMAVLFLISVLLFLIANILAYKKNLIIQYFSTFFLGLLLSAYFWIPALIEKKYILLSIIPIADRNENWVSLNQFLFSKWGFGPPTDPIYGFTYQIGWPFILVFVLAILSFIYLFLRKIKFKSNDKLALVFVTGTALISLLLFPISSVVWKLPLLKEINFPWTVLSQLALISSVLAGYLWFRAYTRYVLIFIVGLSVFLFLPYAKPIEYFDKGDGFYFTNTATTTSSNELMPIWVKDHPFESPKEEVEVINGKGVINNYFDKSNEFSFSVELNSRSIVRINKIYFPGWKIYVDNQEKAIDYENRKGVMEISLEKGTHNIRGEFVNTPVRLFSNIISFLVSFLVLLYIAVKVVGYLLKRWKK